MSPHPRTRVPWSWLALAITAVAGAPACEIRTGSQGSPASPPPPAPQPSPYGSPPGYGPVPQGQPPGYGPPPPQGPPPGYGPSAPQQPGSGPPTAAPGSPTADPISMANLPWLRSRAGTLLSELIAVLPADRKSRVQAIPFVFDDTPGDVNAFAACVDGKALMAITDGMLVIAGHLSEAAANDEVFGTRKVDEYVAFVAQTQRPGAPVVMPPPGFYDPGQRGDGRKLGRQAQIFDETVAFVLGHELAHHYLGHLPCTASPGLLGAGDLARALSGAVPAFNQPNEMAADIGGTNDVLVAGARQAGYRWTERGGLLTMRFFSGVDGMSAIDVLFAFESSHPPPQVRVPVIQQTAAAWRLAGGGWLPTLSL